MAFISRPFPRLLIDSWRQLGKFLPSILCLVTLAAMLIANPTNAEKDLLSGDMGLPASNNRTSPSGKSLIDSSKINTSKRSANLSPAQAAKRVRSQLGGTVISVNTRETDAGVIYGVKLLDNGNMRMISVDGDTGQLLNQ